MKGVVYVVAVMYGINPHHGVLDGVLLLCT
jgi:hypothetical protein